MKLCSILILFFLVIGCKHKSLQEKDSVMVELSEIRKVNRSFPIVSYGTVMAQKESKLSFQIGGQIDEIYKEGTLIKHGGICARINSEEMKYQLNKTLIDYDKSKHNYERALVLINDSAITSEYLETMKSLNDLSKQNVLIAQKKMKKSFIIAPYDGKIVTKMVEEGDVISPFSPVIIFASEDDRLCIHTFLSEKDIINIQHDDSVKVVFDVYEDKSFIGKIDMIGSYPDRITGLYKVEVVLDEIENEMIIHGFKAQLTIFPNRKKEYYTVSADALMGGEGKTGFLYSLDPNNSKKIRKLKVSIDYIKNDTLYITKGICNNDRIVARGGAFLNKNSRILIR
ncbi:efflux RND transporter periplasmic adaptor subunit [Saccharicrinis aurantiacus]|uniref:efflux RND transporter periplasmic adaptor subunit n=1 Tax=Saccharicrinis aurantiacus TaxID=1849719 RepID=UPI0015C568CA|nr:efflux RND transporter periplasmic adaptor subunit [Saccharicrinis aurantiacus]